jgi:hypothetical protein
MTRTRFLAGAPTLGLLLAAAPAVLADSHDLDTEDVAAAEAFDPSTAAEWNQDEALILYGQLEEALAAMGVAEEDMAAAIDFLDGEFGGPGGDDEAEDAEMGDDEFGKNEEDEAVSDEDA